MIKESIKDIICHDISAFNQPLPPKNPGGDCFACATLVALRWLYPEKIFEFSQIWDLFLLTQTNSNGESFEYLGNSWLEYDKVFDNISKKLNLEDLSWRKNSCHPTFTDWGCTAGNWNRDHAQYGKYWKKVCEDLESGVILISINKDGEGPWKNGRWNNIDHLVVIDGVREHVVPIPDMSAATIEQEVRVVCSRKGGAWKTIRDLLNLHGAGAWHVLERKQI